MDAPTDTARVLALLREAPGMKYTTQEIADALDLERRFVAVFVARLHGRGQVQSDRDGRRGRVAFRYWAADGGTA